jgi:hypothetical protein
VDHYFVCISFNMSNVINVPASLGSSSPTLVAVVGTAAVARASRCHAASCMPYSCESEQNSGTNRQRTDIETCQSYGCTEEKRREEGRVKIGSDAHRSASGTQPAALTALHSLTKRWWKHQRKGCGQALPARETEALNNPVPPPSTPSSRRRLYNSTGSYS